MGNYIDVDKFVKWIEKQKRLSKNYTIMMLQETPTADVVEVKHGEWIEKEEMYGDVYYTCSICNNDWTTIDGTPQENFMNYCPFCGAKMDERRDT